MSFNSISKKDNSSDQIKSGIITAIVWSAILFFLFWYKIIEKIPPQQEVVTRMLINFGDNRNGNGAEEPAPQNGSQASQIISQPTETPSTNSSTTEIATTPAKSSTKTKENASDKLLTGKNEKLSVKKSEESENKKNIASSQAKKEAKAHTTSDKNSKGKSQSAVANSTTGRGDGKGRNAIGNLLAGRGKNPGSQGNGNGVGNSGDPLGGDGNGDSKIGINRNLIDFIPGTMGRGGKQPNHNCSASGTIVIAYTVDKSGTVVSAKRLSGLSDPCAVATTTAWVKKYVKAEKAKVSSTGTYSISF